MNSYIQQAVEIINRRNSGDVEFIEMATSILESLTPVIEKEPQYREHAVLETLIEPERMLYFRVVWEDEKGRINVNRGYRCQYNSAIGPYKGGLMFNKYVDSSLIKSLAFEQIFKNALTGFPLGGAKGGSDFDPRGKTDLEVMRFCQSFMTELYKYIGSNVDIPAGDMGVGTREIGYLYGQLKRITSKFDAGALTGKTTAFGGTLLRLKATGFGAAYLANEVISDREGSLDGMTIAMSGFGNITRRTLQKLTSMGAKVVAISGFDGFVYDKDGVNTREKWDFLKKLRASGTYRIASYAEEFGCTFYPGEMPWSLKVDAVFTCDYGRPLELRDAKELVKNGIKYVFEVGGLTVRPEVNRYLRDRDVYVASSNAVSAGGSIVSSLEMTQNSLGIPTSDEDVEEKLQSVMKQIYQRCKDTIDEFDLGNDFYSASNIAAFRKVATAMMAEGQI